MIFKWVLNKHKTQKQNCLRVQLGTIGICGHHNVHVQTVVYEKRECTYEADALNHKIVVLTYLIKYIK